MLSFLNISHYFVKYYIFKLQFRESLMLAHSITKHERGGPGAPPSSSDVIKALCIKSMTELLIETI